MMLQNLIVFGNIANAIFRQSGADLLALFVGQVMECKGQLKGSQENIDFMLLLFLLSCLKDMLLHSLCQLT